MKFEPKKENYLHDIVFERYLGLRATHRISEILNAGGKAVEKKTFHPQSESI
jgi:hypothetical protein